MQAFSAGSTPSGSIHPRALATLVALTVNTTGLHSKAVEDHSDLAPDVVITVCDQAAGDACPIFFGDAVRAHWGLADPSKIEGTDVVISKAFTATVAIIKRRIAAFIASAPETLDRDSLQRQLQKIGVLE